ncbi:MAG TPA: RHS repeat-associated core domain-containing protein [Acidimicrobiales bacterium]|nr:RHS repeat-associated core domain-containing protein [Acidimicrobiales bacterium]
MSYAYFGATETADNPCTGTVEAINQAGNLKSDTAADPDGAGPQSPIVRESRYDGAGRRVAHRVVGDPAWSCTTYDARGRVASERDWSSKTSVFDHSSPAVVTTAFSDSSGASRTTKATSDWLGRPSAYTDEHGTRTRRSYDLAGRLAATYRAGGLPVAPAPPPPSPCEVSGPDAGGYACNTVAFSWADTTGAATVGLGDDTLSAAISMPFAFSWYGQAKTSVFISSNGLLCFATSGCTSYTPPPPPNPGTPNDLMACFWEDLNPGVGGTVKYKTTGSAPNRALVVEFNAVPHYSTGGANTFQLQLKENGEAACMYQSVATDGDSSPTAVGTEDAAGATGLRYRHTEFSATATGVAFSPASPDTPAATGEVTLTQHGYDNAGRLSSLTDKVSGIARTTTFAYDAAGRPSTTTRPNGVVTTNAYDASRRRLSSITHARAGVALSAFTYTRRASGAIATEATTGRSRAFSYDSAGRLVSTAEQTPTATTTRAYAYDANSNRCAAEPACDSTYSYDNADRLVSSPLASAHAYDRRGNLTSATLRDRGPQGNRAQIIAYDANDHATQIDDGVSRIAETLSPSGRVLRRVVTDTATNVVGDDTAFGYDGGGDSPAYARALAGQAVTTYITGPAGLLATDVAGVPTYPLANAHGDVVATTDTAGVLTPTPVTDEFGRGDAPPDRLGWLGTHQRYSSGGHLGLIRMGVRLYDPALGRFLQVDPVAGGCSNDYAYVFGDPINATDLSGTKADCGGIVNQIRRSLFGDQYGSQGKRGMKGVATRYLKQKKFMSKDSGHKRAYESEQRHLRKQIKRWDDNDCWDDPDITSGQMDYVAAGRKWATKAYPWDSSIMFNIGPIGWNWSPILS